MSFEVNVDESAQHPIIILRDGKTNCEASIYAFGALLNSFSILVDDKKINVVDGFGSLDDAIENISNGFKSAKLSPFVCRMNKGEYRFDGNDYKIEKFYLPPHAIHGLVFDAVYKVAATNTDENSASVTLTTTYKGEDKGYPFPYTSSIVWKLETNNKLSVTTTIYQSNGKAIPFADGWHPYFNLGETIDTSTLQFNSNQLIEFDETLIPTGNIVTDERFVNGALLKDIFLDNCFKLNNNNQPAVVLKNNALQLSIEPDASYPYIQIYTPPHRKSIAIENLSGAPDCFNNKMALLLLEPNQEYSFTTSYILKAL
jgi:aldose 1-epimerase